MDTHSYVKQPFAAQPQPADPMDYNSYYVASAQPYPFLAGLPPTPSHSNTVNPDEFGTASPSHAFDFQSYDSYSNYDSNRIPQPPTPQSQTRTSLAPVSNDSGADSTELNGESNRQGSDSADDEELRPRTESKRREQNRAAQRAFRERKERHVKDLEAEVAALKEKQNRIASENELLQIRLQKISTENEILKATSSHPTNQQPPQILPDTTGPMTFSPKDFYADVLHAHENKVPSHRIVVDRESGSRLLGAGATWDYIIGSEQFKRGMVDVGMVSEQLKKVARCDGQGPVFEERCIQAAIEKSVASGSDELM